MTSRNATIVGGRRAAAAAGKDIVQRIYLDHNATTPPDPAVVDRIAAALPAT